MKLILFGGVQGVGKTTLLSWLENIFAGHITVLDPGELFRRYVYTEKTKTAEETEELIVKKIRAMPNDATVVLHWHYAVSRPTGYIPQISFSRLKKIAESKNIEQVILLLIEAPRDAVLRRRLADRRVKKRTLSRATINEEIAADKKFFINQRAVFSGILGTEKVVVLRVANKDLRTAKLLLYAFFKSILNEQKRRANSSFLCRKIRQNILFFGFF